MEDQLVVTLIGDSGRLRALEALKEDPAESGGIDGDAGVALAFELDRLIFADDFAAEFQGTALVGHLDKLWRLVGALGVRNGR